jgi:L-iditol 2-dehydrogenase
MAETMRAAVLMRPGEVRIERRSVPSPGPGQVLVQVKAVGVCGSDIHYFRRGRIGDFVVTKPIVLGHEAAGTVVAPGPGVSLPAVGQAVSIEPGWPCCRCAVCKAGRYNLCQSLVFLATPPDDGAFCDYIAMPADFAHPMPESMGFAEGAMIEPLAVGVHACRQGSIAAGERVLVSGGGPIGLCCLMAALGMGADRVFLTELDRFRRARAMELGAAGVFDPEKDAKALAAALGKGVDLILETSGATSAIQAALDQVRPGGRIVLVGFPAEDKVPVNLTRLMAREASLCTVWRYVNDFPLAIQLAASGKAPVGKLITHRYSLEKTQQAFEEAGRPQRIKAVVEL